MKTDSGFNIVPGAITEIANSVSCGLGGLELNVVSGPLCGADAFCSNAKRFQPTLESSTVRLHALFIMSHVSS